MQKDAREGVVLVVFHGVSWVFQKYEMHGGGATASCVPDWEVVGRRGRKV